MIIIGIIGLILISVAIWNKSERKQNTLFIIGGALLLVYSISIDNVIFSILQGVFILSAFIENLKKRR